jgi:hypothetical protein
MGHGRPSKACSPRERDTKAGRCRCWWNPSHQLQNTRTCGHPRTPWYTWDWNGTLHCSECNVRHTMFPRCHTRTSDITCVQRLRTRQPEARPRPRSVAPPGPRMGANGGRKLRWGLRSKTISRSSSTIVAIALGVQFSVSTKRFRRLCSVLTK